MRTGKSVGFVVETQALRLYNETFTTFEKAINILIMILSTILGFLGGMGAGEIVVLVLIILLLFGAKRIPNLARGIGKGIKEFKDARNGEDPKDDEEKDKV